MPAETLDASSSLSRRACWLLLLAFCVLWFGTLDYRTLIRPDEGRYAEIAREMAVSGDWITPRLNDLKYFEKPPLQYWATAAAFKIAGPQEWAARWWPAFTGFLAVLLVGFTARRLFGPLAAWAAMSMLGGSLWYAFIGHINTLDMALTAFMTAGLCGFLLGQQPQNTPRQQRNWMLFTWASIGCAVMSKGLVGVVLPGAVLVLYTLWSRDWRLWGRRLHLLPGLAVFLLVTAPWFLAVSQRNPEFAHFFFIHEHFQRYAQQGHRREGAMWYFVPMLLAGLVPWLFVWLRSLPAWRIRPGPTAWAERLLIVWAVFIFVFFSISRSKLPSYILPIFPALALLFGAHIGRLPGRTLAHWMLPMGVGGLALLALVPFALKFADADSPVELYRAYQPWLAAAAFALLAGSIAAAWLWHKERLIHGMLAAGFSGLVFTLLALNGHDSLAPLSSSRHLIRQIEAQHGPFRRDLPFFSVDTYEQTLPFYLERPVTLVHYTDEMSLGLKQEPHKGFADIFQWIEHWRRLDAGYMLVTPGMYDELLRGGVPMRLLGRDTRRVIVAR